MARVYPKEMSREKTKRRQSTRAQALASKGLGFASNPNIFIDTKLLIETNVQTRLAQANQNVNTEKACKQKLYKPILCKCVKYKQKKYNNKRRIVIGEIQDSGFDRLQD